MTLSARNPRVRTQLRGALEHRDVAPILEILGPMVTEARRERLTRVIAGRIAAVTLVMDAPHDPHNGAAVVRSCDAFGVHQIHVVERREAFTASTAVAKGTERWVDVMAHRDTPSAVATLERRRFTLVGTHPEGRLVPTELPDISRLALVMGNEHDGISADLAAACHHRVRVPMRGFVESLNVSVTAAILLQHATAGRAGDLDEEARQRLLARYLVLSVPRALDILDASGIRLTPA
ncbi:MAG: RNA methyltransferase [Myxococcota bacterium]